MNDQVIEKTDEKPWFLYLIECKDGSIYTGIAIDVIARYEKHISGKGARYTRAHPPKKLLTVIPCKNHSEALRAELAVKKLKADEKRLFALQNGLPNQTK